MTDFKSTGIVVIVGNYGSGKTEVAINLAVEQKHNGREVNLVDLDLVNPYFRTREARQALSGLGIEMILPPAELLQADLPILTPLAASAIRNPTGLTILDMGGENVGAAVLAVLADAFKPRQRQIQVLQVVNPFRPGTATLAGCLNMREGIEAASKMAVSGWIGNANLMAETDVSTLREGQVFMRRLSEESGLPLVFFTIEQRLLPFASELEAGCPLLVIRRQLVPPWEKPASLSLH